MLSSGDFAQSTVSLHMYMYVTVSYSSTQHTHMCVTNSFKFLVIDSVKSAHAATDTDTTAQSGGMAMFGYDHVQQIQKAEVCKDIVRQDVKLQSHGAEQCSKPYGFDYQARKDVYGFDEQQQLLKMEANKELLLNELCSKTAPPECLTESLPNVVERRAVAPAAVTAVTSHASSEQTQKASMLMQLLDKRDRLKREELNEKLNKDFEAATHVGQATAGGGRAEPNKFLQNIQRVGRQQTRATPAAANTSPQTSDRDSDDDDDGDIDEKHCNSASSPVKLGENIKTSMANSVVDDALHTVNGATNTGDSSIVNKNQTANAPTDASSSTPPDQRGTSSAPSGGNKRRSMRPLVRVSEILAQWRTDDTMLFLRSDVSTSGRADFAAKYAALGRRLDRATHEASELLGTSCSYPVYSHALSAS